MRSNKMSRTEPNFDDETLVAFLDGDLPPSQRTAIESKLREDQQLQQRLQRLQSTWDMLLELPESEPSPHLTQSTIALVTVDLEKGEQSFRWWPFPRHLLMLMVIALLVSGLGAITGYALSYAQRLRLVKQLPAIVEFRVLQHIDSWDWLEMLTQIEYLHEAAEYLQTTGEGSAPVVIGKEPLPSEPSGRWKWMQSLDAQATARLHANVEDFRRLSVHRQEQLYDIADRLLADPQREELLAAARSYAVLLDTEGTKREQAIKQMSPTERVAEIEQIIARNLLIKYADEMSPADRNALLDWIERMRRKPDMPFAFDPYQLIIDELVQDPQVSLITTEDIDQLLTQLSPFPAELFRKLPSEYEQRAIIIRWILTLTQQGDRPKLPATEVLMNKFQQLPRQDQDLLELLPEEEVQEYLQQMLGVRSNLNGDS
ncbi:MAG: hypothetical protein KatS3mg111_0102 [Pirellulaceae bacterium]|nr:MAG: hypothetical protein KatS3mg111_0102 [Pirellulaceae bacterium]